MSTLARMPAALLSTLLLAAAVLVNQSAVHWRDNIADEHLFGYSGWQVWHGARPYRDVWDNKPPGIWWVNALAQGLCGPGVIPDLWIGSLALAGTLAAFIAAARLLYGRGILPGGLAMGCAVLTHLRFECGANRTETLVLLCESLAALSYLGWLRDGRTRWLVAAGLGAGAAPLFKQTGVAIGLACGAHLLGWCTVRRRAAGRLAPGARRPARASFTPLLVYGVALAALPSAAGAVLLAQEALGEAWFAVVTFNRWAFRLGHASWGWTGQSLRTYWPELATLHPLWWLAGLSLALTAAALLTRRPSWAMERRASGMRLLLWMWLAASFYLACVGTGRQAYHLAPLLAPLALIALHPLGWLLGRRPQQVAWRRPSAAAALVVTVFLLEPLAGDSLAHARSCWATKPAWYALTRRAPAEYELQAAAIREWTRPDDLLYVWGWSPGTYRYAYRRCPSRFATIEKVSHIPPRADFIVQQAMQDVRRRPPAVFVISEADYAFMQQRPDDFSRWLESRYRLRQTIAGMCLLVRRAPAGPEDPP